MGKALSKTYICGSQNGNKAWVTVNAQDNCHVTIRVRAGCGGPEKSCGLTSFPGIFKNEKGSGHGHRETYF